MNIDTTATVAGVQEIGHWIDGAHRPSASGRTADVFNPATGAVICAGRSGGRGGDRRCDRFR